MKIDCPKVVRRAHILICISIGWWGVGYTYAMIYLIGGTARVGKSTLAALMLERKHISNISTDVIRNLLDSSPTQLGLKALEEDKKAEVFFPYLLQFLKILQNKYEDYVIEGDLFTPEQVTSLKEKIELRCCFLGTSNITLEDIKKSDPKSDWVSNLSQEKQNTLPEYFIKKSKKIEQEASKNNFPYFDIYPDRNASLESAYNSLFS
ncbi:MAG: hypothetical protein JWN37_95 [Candidatus Nomurabacteria bacterium]|nr:hypothetical protein [Candidatus Nomurabacteria bacterium]